jgi:hypothetical protein
MIPKSSSSAVSPFTRSRDPRGREQRLIRLSNPNTEGATGFCLDVYDLVLSKYAAGREKDMAFNRALVRYGCVAETTLLELATALPLDDEMKNIVLRRINADFAAVDS